MIDISLSASNLERQARARLVGQRLPAGVPSAVAVREVLEAGAIDAGDLVAVVVALDALAAESPAAAVAVALHLACALSIDDPSLLRGERLGSLTLATDEVPVEREGRLTGRASWVAPLDGAAVALVGTRRGADLVACAVALDEPTLIVEPVDAAGLPGLVIGHLRCAETPGRIIGPTMPAMARARILLSAVGLGMARRAVREALAGTPGTHRGAGGEQTAQGQVADAATDLDAALLLTWKAASLPLSLARASMAKLAATVAAQRAVERATQVVGAESFRQGHVLGRLAQDVRALELFAGRTEALREAVALDEL